MQAEAASAGMGVCCKLPFEILWRVLGSQSHWPTGWQIQRGRGSKGDDRDMISLDPPSNVAFRITSRNYVVARLLSGAADTRFIREIEKHSTKRHVLRTTPKTVVRFAQFVRSRQKAKQHLIKLC